MLMPAFLALLNILHAAVGAAGEMLQASAAGTSEQQGLGSASIKTEAAAVSRGSAAPATLPAAAIPASAFASAAEG